MSIDTAHSRAYIAVLMDCAVSISNCGTTRSWLRVDRSITGRKSLVFFVRSSGSGSWGQALWRILQQAVYSLLWICLPVLHRKLYGHPREWRWSMPTPEGRPTSGFRSPGATSRRISCRLDAAVTADVTPLQESLAMILICSSRSWTSCLQVSGPVEKPPENL